MCDCTAFNVFTKPDTRHTLTKGIVSGGPSAVFLAVDQRRIEQTVDQVAAIARHVHHRQITRIDAIPEGIGQVQLWTMDTWNTRTRAGS